MQFDKQNKMSKKEQTKFLKKKDELNMKKKKNNDSDDDNDQSSDSENDKIDMVKYQKFLFKLFPSKFLEKKNKEVSSSSKEESNKKTNLIKSKNSKNKEEENKKINSYKSKSKSKKEESESESESDDYEDYDEDDEYDEEYDDDDDDEDYEDEDDEEYDDDEDDEYEDDDDDDDEDDEDDEYEDDKKTKLKKLNKNSKINIILTIGDKKNKNLEEDEQDYEDNNYDEEYNDYYSNSEFSTEDEDEDVSISSDESDKKKKSKKNSKKEKEVKKTSKKESKDDLKEELNEELNEKSKENDLTDEQILMKLKELYKMNKNDTIKQCIDVCENKIKKETKKNKKHEKKIKSKNLRIFRKIIKDKNTLNDVSFYEKLDSTEQNKIIKELKEVNKIIRVEKPYRISLLESNIPHVFKGAAMKKINSLRYLEPGSGEYYKIKNWVDTFMRIPFNVYNNLPINFNDGVEKCHEFMEQSQKTLDNAVYGLNDAKMQIMQLLGQLVINPSAIGTAIAIHGPPGTGKTSLVKEGISKILNRPFSFIALGGATDSSFLEGHSYTYEGSTWGKILQTLIDSKCMNPVFFFDEVDKISDTPRGEEITGILTHLTDTTQNSQFHDKYFAEIDFDLSKCLFIFSYNDESKVNPILKDRMYRIQTKGYNQKQKIIIVNDYLLPKIREQVKFNSEDVIIPDDSIYFIIENYCNKEDGVRNLKRCLEIIFTKLNLYRLMKPDTNLFENEMSIKVSFPFTVTKDIVEKLIKKDTENISHLHSLYI